MRIDCGTCAVRGQACSDCVVTFLTIGVRAPDVRAPDVRAPDQGLSDVRELDVRDLDEAERAAIAVLSSSGLVPPLRLTRRA